MKGLLYKDLLASRNVLLGGCFVLFFSLAFTWALVDKEAMNGLIVPGLMFWVVLIAAYILFQRDEQSKWNLYALSLPVDKRLLVKSRYLFLLSLLLIGSLPGFFIAALFQNLTPTVLGSFLTSFASLFLALGIFIPRAYRRGSSGAVLLLVFLYLLLFLLQIGISQFGKLISGFTMLFDFLPGIVYFIAAAGWLLGSYFHSCKVLQAGDTL